jgi:hypothetical protein
MTSAHGNTGETVNMAEHVIDVATDRGIPFRVVYGRRQYRDGSYSTQPVISFYDRRYAGNKGFDAHGQFVSDYDVESMLRRHSGYALDLDSGVPNWSVDASSMALVKTWLVHIFLAR